jgi:hypothetical protein
MSDNTKKNYPHQKGLVRTIKAQESFLLHNGFKIINITNRNITIKIIKPEDTTEAKEAKENEAQLMLKFKEWK